jgi:hypothetical protein
MSSPILPYTFGVIMIVLASYLFYSASKVYKVIEGSTVTYNPTKAVGYVISGILCLGISYLGFTQQSIGDILAGISKLDQQMRSSSVNNTSFSLSK